MGLGDFTDEGSGGSKEYVRITREEFEDFLDEEGYDWRVVTPNASENPVLKFSGELVYVIDCIGHEDLGLRVYSSISKRDNKARDKGSDAIRTVIWSKELERPIGGRARTHRIRTWRKNLRGKIESLEEEWKDSVEKCDECGSWMVKREGKYGDFLGCTNYPECENTEEIQ